MFISASTHFLLNKLTQEEETQNFELTNNIKTKFEVIFKNQIAKIVNPKEEFSKLELCFLMVIILTEKKEVWSNQPYIVDYLLLAVDSVSIETCMTNCFFAISLLKFLIKTANKTQGIIPKVNLSKLIKNLHYICLYYGLSLETEQEYLTFLHRGLYENKLRSNT